MNAPTDRGPFSSPEQPLDALSIDFRRIHPDRTRNPLQTQNDILHVATELFAEHGLSGARIDQIAEMTRTSKRMIYYYFGSKEGLYEAVLERAFLFKWQSDSTLDILAMDAIEGLTHITGYMFDNFNEHPTFARLVAAENINRGRFLHNLRRIKNRMPPIVEQIERLVERGIFEGRFRADLDHWDLYWLMSACCTYGVVSRYSFDVLLENRPEDLSINRHRAIALDAVRAWATATPSA